MQRILIMGNSGAGKSTLAKKLSEKYQIPRLDLDVLAWEDTEPPSRKPLEESKQLIDEFVDENNSWVIEGCYADLLTIVSANASELLFLNPGVEVCVSNCKNRPWEPHKYESPEAQDANLEMLIGWVKQYDSRDDEFSLKAHRNVFDAFSGVKKEFLSNDWDIE